MKYKLTRFDNVEPADFGVACTQAERQLAQEMAKDTEKYVPALTGAFSRNTRVINNMIIYQGWQVRYLYEGVKMVSAATGRGPFPVKDRGLRWHKHEKLRPTTEPLNYTKKPHPLATDHWMEESERVNGEKWSKFAEEAIANEL